MRSIACLFLACACATTGAAPMSKAKPDLVETLLLGEWVAVEVEEKEKPAGLKSLKDDIWLARFSEGSVRLIADGDQPGTLEFLIRRREEGGNLYDFDFHKGDDKPNHAMIRIHDKDTFSLVVHSRFRPNRPDDRPTEFTTKNNAERDPCGLWNPLLFKFKRVAKTEKALDAIDAFHKPTSKK